MPKLIDRKVIRGIIYKYCSGCRKYHPESEFNKCSKATDYLQSYCKECNIEYCRRWHEKHRNR